MTLVSNRVGDRGQPYAAQAWRWPHGVNAWQDIGFSDTKEGAEKLMEAILLHPCVEYARVKCRISGGFVVKDSCPGCGSDPDGCLCGHKDGNRS